MSQVSRRPEGSSPRFGSVEGAVSLLPVWVSAALAIVLLCAGVAAHAQSSSPLMQWLTQELEPTLSQRFTQHPRLRGQAVQVLAMRGTQERVRSDALTQSIVRHLGEALTNQSGTRVVPVGADPSAQACMAQSAVEYRVGVDVRAAGTGVQVDVRVLDVAEGSWVGGFGGSWAGQLSGRERDALAREVLAEGARGARELPFEVGQADLVAKALEAQIDCVLAGARQREPRGAALYLQPAGELDAHLQKAGLLLMHGLRSGHGWHQVTERDQADLLLELHTQALDGELSVFWVTLSRPRAEDRAGVVASASTYVNGEVAQGAARVAGVGRPAPPAAVNPPPAQAVPGPSTPQLGLEQGALLSRPTLRTYRSAAACADASGGGRPGAPCDLVEVEVTRPATVFWLWQPASCRLEGSAGVSAPRVVSRRAQGGTKITARLQSTGEDAYESLYVIAVDTAGAVQDVRAVLERYPGGRGCDAPHWDRDLRRWALALESTLLRLGPAADWQAVRAPRRATRMASSQVES